MKPIIIDMKDMSDSTEVYSSRPHPFFVIFIYLILGMVIAAFLWMYLFKMDIVVKSNGIFKTDNAIQSISSTATGKVKESNLEEGKYVEEGELLFSVEHEKEDATLTAYEDALSDINDRILMMDAYLKYLDGDASEFLALSDNQYYQEFCDRKSVINNNIDTTTVTASNQKQQYADSVHSIQESIAYYNEQIEQWNQVLNCVKNHNNTFAEEDTFYHTYVDSFLTNYQSLETQYNTKITQYQNESETVATAQKATYQETIENTKNEKDKALKNLELEQISTIEQQIQTTKSSLVTLEGNLATAQSQLNASANGTAGLSNDNVLLSEKNAVTTDMTSYKTKKEEYEKNIDALTKSIGQYEVKAETTGYLSLNGELSAGNYIQEGTAVCQIIPEDTTKYYAEIYIANGDIGKIKEGQEVKFEIAAYPSSQYGYFTGVVETIAKDIKVDNSSGSAYYLVKVHCENATLCNQKGESVSVMNGMACQAKIVTDEQSVLEYLLRKIDLLD